MILAELTMATAERAPAVGLITIPRAVLSAAAGVFYSVERAVIGDDNVRTARRNAWDAMCADRARAQARADTRAAVAALAASNTLIVRTGHSPLTAQIGAAQIGAAQTGAGQSGGGQRSVGSSPRSSASQATLVSTGA
jgi:hypothetical protein